MTQKIRRAAQGQVLTANHYNQVVDGANLAIDVLGPPRSLRLSSADSTDVELDPDGNGIIDGIGTIQYTETDRETTTVRVEDPNDPDVYVDVERIDKITFRSAFNRITLILDW